MTLDERVAVLSRDPLFRSARLEPEALADVASRLTAVALRAGNPVFREGDAGDRMYVIASGKIGIFRQMGNTRVAVAELGEGAHFGELALIDGARRSADADCLADASVLALDAVAFDELIERHPRLALAFLRVMSQRLRNTLGRVEDDDENPLRDRYPHPIASVYHAVLVAAEPRAKLERVFDLLEVTLRYLGLVTTAAYLASGGKSRWLDDKLVTGLGKTTLGTWMLLLREALEPYAKAPRGFWIPELCEAIFERPGRPGPALADLDEVVRFRNDQRHGAGGALTDKHAETAVAAHLPVLERALTRLAVLERYPLVSIDKMDFAKGEFRYRVLRCMGSHGNFPLDTLTGALPHETGKLYLLRPSDHALLPLEPWLALDTCSVCATREVFLLTGSGQDAAEYTEFTRGHSHAVADGRAVLDAVVAEARARLRHAERR